MRQLDYGEQQASHKDCQIRSVEYIYPGVKTSFCKQYIYRSWMYIIMVSSVHPNVSTIYESLSGVIAEKRRHVTSKDWFMIHPFSLIRIFWEVFMTVAQLMVLISTPIELAFCDLHLICCNLVNAMGGFSCICSVDNFLNFVTGRLSHYTISMEFKRVTIHYVKTWFFLDFLSTFPWEYVFIYYYSYTFRGYLYLGRLVYVLRLYRVKRFIECLRLACKLLKLRDIIKSGIIFSVTTFLLWIWIFTAQIYISTFMTCDCFYRTPRIGHPGRTSKTQQLINAFFAGTAYVAFTGSTMLPMLTWDELVAETLCVSACFLWQLYALTYITIELIPIDTSPVKYQMMNRQLGAYMTTKRLPPYTKRRIEMYYEHRYRKTFFREQKILGNMSERLRREVQLQSCEKMIRGMSLFQKMPHHIIAKLAPCLRMDMFLPNEVIVKAGSIGDEMYFLHSGTVAIYAKWGEEVRHIEDGGYFGEVAMVLKNERRLASVTAVTVCELYILTRPDFLRVLRPFRELHRGIERVARERLEQMVLRESKRREQRRQLMKEQRKKGAALRAAQGSDVSSSESSASGASVVTPVPPSVIKEGDKDEDQATASLSSPAPTATTDPAAAPDDEAPPASPPPPPSPGDRP